MKHQPSIEDRVAEHYGVLSQQLRRAADYVVANPLDVATRSLRAVSAASDVSPATFSRLARAIGFDSFEDMKEQSRSAVGQKVMSFSEKAAALRAGDDGPAAILQRQGEACIGNITALVNETSPAKLDAAAASLGGADRVFLYGALGSTGIAEYMAYLASYFAPHWALAGRMGASLGATVSNLGAGDAMLIVTKTPYVRRACIAAQQAHDKGADVVLITDMHQCPAIPFATHSFIVPSESPQFFSSYVATLVLIESIIAMIVATSDGDASASIRKVEDRNRTLGEYWAD